MPKVTVYYFETYNPNKDEWDKSKSMATMEEIDRIATTKDCNIFKDTAIEVDESELNIKGRHHPTQKH